MRRIATLLAVLAALALAACGTTGAGSGTGGTVAQRTPTPAGVPFLSASPPSGGGDALVACTAVPVATAEQLTGTSALTQETNTSAGGVSECVYADTSSGAGLVAVIEQIAGIGAAAIMQAAIASASHSAGGQDQPVSGLGDQALKNVEANGATVAFAKGSTMAVVGAYGSIRSGDAIESDIEALCRTMAGQI